MSVQPGDASSLQSCVIVVRPGRRDGLGFLECRAVAWPVVLCISSLSIFGYWHIQAVSKWLDHVANRIIMTTVEGRLGLEVSIWMYCIVEALVILTPALLLLGCLRTREPRIVLFCGNCDSAIQEDGGVTCPECGRINTTTQLLRLSRVRSATRWRRFVFQGIVPAAVAAAVIRVLYEIYLFQVVEGAVARYAQERAWMPASGAAVLAETTVAAFYALLILTPIAVSRLFSNRSPAAAFACHSCGYCLRGMRLVSCRSCGWLCELP